MARSKEKQHSASHHRRPDYVEDDKQRKGRSATSAEMGERSVGGSAAGAPGNRNHITKTRIRSRERNVGSSRQAERDGKDRDAGRWRSGGSPNEWSRRSPSRNGADQAQPSARHSSQSPGRSDQSDDRHEGGDSRDDDSSSPEDARDSYNSGSVRSNRELGRNLSGGDRYPADVASPDRRRLPREEKWRKDQSSSVERRDTSGAGSSTSKKVGARNHSNIPTSSLSSFHHHRRGDSQSRRRPRSRSTSSSSSDGCDGQEHRRADRHANATSDSDGSRNSDGKRSNRFVRSDDRRSSSPRSGSGSPIARGDGSGGSAIRSGARPTRSSRNREPSGARSSEDEGRRSSSHERDRSLSSEHRPRENGHHPRSSSRRTHDHLAAAEADAGQSARDATRSRSRPDCVPATGGKNFKLDADSDADSADSVENSRDTGRRKDGADIQRDSRDRHRREDESSRRPSFPTSGKGRDGTERLARKSSRITLIDGADSFVGARGGSDDRDRKRRGDNQHDSFERNRESNDSQRRHRSSSHDDAAEEGNLPADAGRRFFPGTLSSSQHQKAKIARESSSTPRERDREREGRSVGGDRRNSSVDDTYARPPVDSGVKKRSTTKLSRSSSAPLVKTKSLGSDDARSSDGSNDISSSRKHHSTKRRESPSPERSPRVARLKKKRNPSFTAEDHSDADEQTSPKPKKRRKSIDGFGSSSPEAAARKGGSRVRKTERDRNLSQDGLLHARHGEGKGRNGREDADRRSRSVSVSPPPPPRKPGKGKRRAHPSGAREDDGHDVDNPSFRKKDREGARRQMDPPDERDMDVDESPYRKSNGVGDDEDAVEGGRLSPSAVLKKKKKKKTGERFVGDSRRKVARTPRDAGDGFPALEEDDDAAFNEKEEEYDPMDEDGADNASAYDSGLERGSDKDFISPKKKKKKKQRRDSVVDDIGSDGYDERGNGTGTASTSVKAKQKKSASSASPEELRRSKAAAARHDDEFSNDRGGDLAPLAKKKKKKKRVFDNDEAINDSRAFVPTATSGGRNPGRNDSSGRAHSQNGGLAGSGSGGASPARPNSGGDGRSRKHSGAGSEMESGGGSGAVAARKRKDSTATTVEKEVELSAEDLELMKGLRKYLKDKHVKNVYSKLQGWRPRVHRGSKYDSHKYLDADGKEYNTKGEVLAALQGLRGGYQEERVERQTISREEALKRANELFEKRGAELVGDRGANAPPVQVSDLLVENLGEIDTRPGFHSSKSIFPPGYKAIRMVIDGRQQRALKARCSIYVDADAPAFRIELLGKTKGSGGETVFEAPTQKECFHHVFKALDTVGGRAKESVLGGPLFFNAAVKALVEGMPGSGECENYVFTAMRGATPMFKKDAAATVAAAERAEEKMRSELEKAWWNGMPDTDKAKLRAADKHARGRKKERDHREDEQEKRKRKKKSPAGSKTRRDTSGASADAKDDGGIGGEAPPVPERAIRKVKPAAPRRPKKQESDKRSQLFPAVARDVQAYINAKRKEARSMVLNRFDAEQRGLMTDSAAIEDSKLPGFSDPWPRPSNPATEAQSSEPVADGNRTGSGGAPGLDAVEDDMCNRLRLPESVRLKHAVQVWNALRVFPRPMGVRPPPSLEALMQAIVTLSPRWSPEGESARDNNGDFVNGVLSSRMRGYTAGSSSTAAVGEEDGEAEFDDKKASIRATRGGRGRGGGRRGVCVGGGEGGGGTTMEVDEAGGGDDDTKKEAQALMDGICMSIVRVLSIDLHAVLGSPCDQPRDRERDHVAMEEVFVVNQLTWPELARQCIVAYMTREYLNMPDSEVAGWVRGSERHWTTERPASLLLRKRIEQKWNTPPAGADTTPPHHYHHPPPQYANATYAGRPDDSSHESTTNRERWGDGNGIAAVSAKVAPAFAGVLQAGATGSESAAVPDASRFKRGRSLALGTPMRPNSGVGDDDAAAGGHDGAGVKLEGGVSFGDAAGAGIARAKANTATAAAAGVVADDSMDVDGGSRGMAGVGHGAVKVEEGVKTEASGGVVMEVDEAEEEEEDVEESTEENDEVVLRQRLHSLVEDESGSTAEVVRRCAVVLREVARHKACGFFLFPIDEEQVPDYFDVIEHPITVLSILDELEGYVPSAMTGEDDDVLVDKFALSVRRMWENCWSYNHEGTKAWIAAIRLSSVFERLLREWILRSSPPPPRLADLLASEGRPCSTCGVTYEPATTAPSTGINSAVFSAAAEHSTAAYVSGPGVYSSTGDLGDTMPVPPGTIVCDCCDATYHLECLRPPLREVPRAEWFCPACVSPGLGDGRAPSSEAGGVGSAAEAMITLRRPPPRGGFGCWSRYAQSAAGNVPVRDGVGINDRGGAEGEGDGEPPLLCGSGDGGSLERGGGWAGSLGMGGMGDWGPSPAVPKALDWSLSRQARERLETEDQARVLHDALRILSRRDGGWLPSQTSCWSPGEWIAVLTALVALATETQTLNQYFAEAEQRCENLRKKAVSGAKMSARSFQGMLLSVGGNAAVDFWQRLLDEAGGEDDLKEDEDDDDDEEDEDFGKNPGVCIVCWLPTTNIDASMILICDGCQGEVHLLKACSGLRKKPAEDTQFYCRGCKARRDRQARAQAAADEAAAAAAAAAEAEGAGEGGDKSMAVSGGGVTQKKAPRTEYCEDVEDQERRKKREIALKTSVVERIVESKIQAEKERNRTKEEGLSKAAAAVKGTGGKAEAKATPAQATRGSAAAGGGGGKAGAGAGGASGSGVAKRKRCGNCTGCRAKPCDRCKYCLDSKKNNGPNKLKQPCIKRRCRNMPGDTIDWADALSSDRGPNAPLDVECEYCYKREKELCSPMVHDFSAEEAEEFLKEQEAEYAESGGGGGSEGAHRKVRFPRFPRARTGPGSSPRASGPVVHEACAQSMFKARAERAQHKLRGLREQAVEEAIRLGGYQTLPLGRDRHGRFYFRFPGDPSRVFVSHEVLEGDEEGLYKSMHCEDQHGENMDVDQSETTNNNETSGTSYSSDGHHPLLPRDPAPGDLTVYENESDIAALIAWLNESGQREGPLRAAVLRAFPPQAQGTRAAAAARSPNDAESAASKSGNNDGSGGRPNDKNDKVSPIGGRAASGSCADAREQHEGNAADVGNDNDDANGQGNNIAETTAHGSSLSGADRSELLSRPFGAVNSGGVHPTTSGDNGGDASGAVGNAAENEADNNEHAAAGGGGVAALAGSRRRGRQSSGEPRATLAHPRRSAELPRLLAEGAVELRLATNPPGGHGNVMLPASEAVVEFDNDAEADQDNPSNEGAVTWTTKFHALRLHDTSTGQVLAASQKQGILVSYEIWRGQIMVENTPTDAPYDKNGVYFFNVPKFHRTGTFKLVFHVSPAAPLLPPPPLATDPSAGGAGDAGNEAGTSGEGEGAGEGKEGSSPSSQSPTPPPPPKVFNIKPLEYIVQVSPRFTHTGAVAALHKLRALQFIKHRNREESDGMAVDLDLPFDCEEVPCLKAGLVAVLNALPRGAFKEGGAAEALDADASEAEGGADGHGSPAVETGWTPALRDCWQSHVASATTSQELMEALLLMECCLDPKWLKPWYRPIQHKMPSTSHLLRLSTPAAVALRLFALDRAISYEKVCSALSRGSRLRSGIQLRERGGGDDVCGSRRGSASSRSSQNGRRAARSALQPEPAKPVGRQTRTSRAAEDEGTTRSPPRRGRRVSGGGGGRGSRRGSSGRSRDLSPGSWEEDDEEEDEDEDEDEDEEDEESEDDSEEDCEEEIRGDGGSGGRASAAGKRGSVGAERGGGVDRRRKREEVNYYEEEDSGEENGGGANVYGGPQQQQSSAESRKMTVADRRKAGNNSSKRKRQRTTSASGTAGRPSRAESHVEDDVVLAAAAAAGHGQDVATAEAPTEYICNVCTYTNAIHAEKCEICSTRRPANANPARRSAAASPGGGAAQRKRSRQQQNLMAMSPSMVHEQGSDAFGHHDGGRPSGVGSNGDDDYGGAASDLQGDDSFSKTSSNDNSSRGANSKRGRGRSRTPSKSGNNSNRRRSSVDTTTTTSTPAAATARASLADGGSSRQRRQVPRVNYNEDGNADDDDGVEPPQTGGRGGSSASNRRRAGGRAGGQAANERPLSIREELARGGGLEEGLPDEVRFFRARVRKAIGRIAPQGFAEHFIEPVDLQAYPDYVHLVSQPMDLATILVKLRRGEYDSSEGRGRLARDIDLIPENCETFNGKRVLISENAHLVAQTFHNFLNRSERDPEPRSRQMKGSVTSMMRGGPSPVGGGSTMMQEAPSMMEGPPSMMEGPPSMVDAASSMMEGAPSLMEGAPSLMDGTHSMMGGVHSMMGEAPSMMQGAPSMMGGGGPPMMVGGPSMMSVGPSMMGGVPSMIGGTGSMMAGAPSMLGGHSMVGSASSMMGGQPSLFGGAGSMLDGGGGGGWGAGGGTNQQFVSTEMDTGGGACPGCGYAFAAGDEQSALVVYCEACGTKHHAVCVGARQQGAAYSWFCIHCNHENRGYGF